MSYSTYQLPTGYAGQAHHMEESQYPTGVPVHEDFLTGPDAMSQHGCPPEMLAAPEVGMEEISNFLLSLGVSDQNPSPEILNSPHGSSTRIGTPSFQPAERASSLADALGPLRGRPTLTISTAWDASVNPPALAIPHHLQTPVIVTPPPRTPLPASPPSSSPAPTSPASYVSLHIPHAHSRRHSESAISLSPMLDYNHQQTGLQTQSPESLNSPNSLLPSSPMTLGRARSFSNSSMLHARSRSDASGIPNQGPSVSADLLSPEWMRDDERNGGRALSRSSSRGSSRRASPYPSRSVSPNPSVSSQESYPVSPLTPASAEGDAPPLSPGNKPIVKKIVTSDKVAEASILRRKSSDDPPRFKCEHCGRCLTSKHNLDGHIRSHVNERPYACAHHSCEKRFSRKSDCKRHEETVHNSNIFKCSKCDAIFSRKDALNKHTKGCTNVPGLVTGTPFSASSGEKQS